MLTGGLLAAIVVLGALALADDTAGAGRITLEAIATGLLLVLGFAAAVYVAAYGYTGFDGHRSVRLTGKVLFWMAVVAAVIALIAVGGGFSWSSGDSSSDGDSGGGGGDAGSTGGRHGVWSWIPSFDWLGGGGGQRTNSRSAPTSQSICIACGARMAGPAGVCTACAYRDTYSSRW